MKIKVCTVVLAMFGLSALAVAQPVNEGTLSGCFAPPPGPAALATTFAAGTTCGSSFQIRYFANLTAGDSFIDVTNDGSVITLASVKTTSDLTANYSTGNICVNVYTFDPAEEMVSCCACRVTPNGLVSLSAQQDLIGNTLTPASPTAITVKLLATTPLIQGTNPLTATESCNPAFPFGLFGGTATIAIPPNTLQAAGVFDLLAPAMHAWGTTLHAQPGGRLRATETEFSQAALGIVSAAGVNP